MLMNVMGKRQVYDRVCTDEVRMGRDPNDELWYWRWAIAKHGFRSVKDTCWGVKLEGVTVPERFRYLTCTEDLVDLYREIDRIENGIVHASKVDWNKVVSSELTKMEAESEAVCEEIEASNKRAREETMGMTSEELWQWIEEQDKHYPKYSEGSPKKRARKELIKKEERRRAVARAAEYRAKQERLKAEKRERKHERAEFEAAFKKEFAKAWKNKQAEAKADAKKKQDAPKPKVKKPAKIVYPELFETVKADVNGNEFGEISLF